jgi:hypothetical protein
VSLVVLPKEDIIEPEAATDKAGELSRRRRSPPPDGPAAGEPFDFGVEVVFGSLVVFPFFIMLASVSP